MYLHVWWLCMHIFKVFRLIIVLCYINMNVITQGTDFRAWVYNHGSDCVCVKC